ncbi:MAG: ABC transporter permease [Clostridiaceae bacterium]|nr:ABC transporter permease [Clostridiaceae bacterium]
MTFKTSLFNKGLILSAIKRFWWVGALYTLLLFFILPLRHMMLKNNVTNEWSRNQISNSLNLNSHQNGFQFLLIIIVPVVLATLIFRYIQKSNTASMIHSLPYTRKTLYASHNAAGLLLFVLPIIFITIILMLLQITTNLSDYYSFSHIVAWGGHTLLFHLLFFSIAVFVGMFTGNSIAQMVFTYILHFLPAGLYVLTTHNLSQLLHGYNTSSFYNSLLDHLPIFTLLNARGGVDYSTTLNILGYIIASIIFFVTAYYVYKIRKIEVAGDVIAFRKIRPVFKYGVTICSMLLGGAYFTGIGGGSFSTIVFGYIFSSFLGYWIAEMLMEKSFKVWGAYKGYIAYTLIILMVLIGIRMDVTGYVGRVPESHEVESVYLGPLHEWEWVRRGEMPHEYNRMHRSGYFFETQENIENMIVLHKDLIQGSTPMDGIYRYQHIIYTLKNGKHLIRQYLINDEAYAASLTPIYESLEYKQERFPVIHQSNEDIKWIEINDYRSPKKSVVLSDSDELQEFITLLQEDIHNATFETLATDSSYMVTIMDAEEKRIDYGIRESYTSVFQWIRESDYYEEITLLPEDVGYVILDNMKGSHDYRTVEIRDKDVIKELMDLTKPSYHHSYQPDSISVRFHMKSNSRDSHHLGYLNSTSAVSGKLSYYLNQLQ